MKQISIIDYGCGNIRSVYNAFDSVIEKKKSRVIITSKKTEIINSSHIVLPGVGSFKSCVDGLINSRLLETITNRVLLEGVPFLGICVGMQMLASKGYENGVLEGLGWVSGKVKKLKKTKQIIKIPHMGWNNLKIEKDSTFLKKLNLKTRLSDVSAYFVHSYNFITDEKKNKIMTTHYGQEITAMIAKDNIIGTQFHPEKSHNFGLKFLETFIQSEEF